MWSILLRDTGEFAPCWYIKYTVVIQCIEILVCLAVNPNTQPIFRIFTIFFSVNINLESITIMKGKIIVNKGKSSLQRRMSKLYNSETNRNAIQIRPLIMLININEVDVKK